MSGRSLRRAILPARKDRILGGMAWSDPLGDRWNKILYRSSPCKVGGGAGSQSPSPSPS